MSLDVLTPISAEARCARAMRAWRTACVDAAALQMQAVRFEQTRRAVACAQTWSDVASHAAWYHPPALTTECTTQNRPLLTPRRASCDLNWTLPWLRRQATRAAALGRGAGGATDACTVSARMGATRANLQELGCGMQREEGDHRHEA